MIRVYLDWNVISSLKRPENKTLKESINSNKDKFLFPYSPAHFQDLMKSYSPDNIHFKPDLDALEHLAEKHFIRWEEGNISPLMGSAEEYFLYEKEKNIDFTLLDLDNIISSLDEIGDDGNHGKLGEFMKALLKFQPIESEFKENNSELKKKIFPNITDTSNLWDIVKDIFPFMKNLLENKAYYLDLRSSVGLNGFKLDQNAGNWKDEEVIIKIEEYLKSLGTNMTFKEYVEFTIALNKKEKNRYEFFTTAYLLLDIIGYKPDKLPKPSDNLFNIIADGEHAFYAAHCDYFIVGDKNLRKKAKVLFNELNIQTIVLSPDDFINEVNLKIHVIPEVSINLFQDIINYLKEENLVEYLPKSENNEPDVYVFKLPIFYFNFFNYAIYRKYQESSGGVLTLTRIFKNYSNFIYFTEAEKIVDKVTSLFGFEDLIERNKKKKEFVYEDIGTQFIWHLENGQVILENDEEKKRPELTYIFLFGKEESSETNTG